VRNVSGRELAKTLERLGWVLLRVHGSHHIYGKQGERAHISVPVHGNTPLKRGLLTHLMKLAGVKESDF
jgi:predicted RNA binding protein YcfA (HicA-like mRNA interferase family)